jgi:predicted Zn-dependent protease
MKLKRVVVTSFAALFASCAVILPTPPVSDNSAVLELVQVARADVDAGRVPNAVAAIERALRIEPKNPRLWQELARVRLKEGDYAQAENLAARSNSWAGSDNDLRAENWRLIAEARSARGDDTGAKAALERAKQAGR